MRLLRVLELEAETPVQRLVAAEVRQHADEAGEGHGRRFRERLRRDQGRGEQLPAQPDQVVERPPQAGCSGLPQLGADPERLEHRAGEVVGERHLSAAGDVVGEHLEAGVRVDAPLSGPRDRLVALEREPGGMGEQVPDGRARRAGRLVEVDRGFLGGDEDGERGRELGHGRPAEDAPVSVPGEHPARQERGRGGVGRSPLLDLTQSVHPGDTTAAMEPWSYDFRGRLDEHVFESEALKGNPLGDPHERPLWVYVPPGYDDNPERRYPSVYAIQGMTGQVDMWRDLFGGLATHAGDALFEVCYQPEFRQDARSLRDDYDGSYEKFFEDFRSRPPLSKKSDYHLLNSYTMAACYSAEEDGTVTLPFDLATGELLPEVWERWLAWDPVRMVPRYADALRSLTAIYIDAGKRDEFYLDLGAEAFRRALEEIGVTDVFFELFDATHMGIEYRYPLALEYLAERLSP